MPRKEPERETGPGIMRGSNTPWAQGPANSGGHASMVFSNYSGSAQCKFAGPCAQGVLDTVIVPRPMSLGRPRLFVLFKDNAFLGTSAHERVPLAGSSPATCRLPAGFPLWVAASPNASGLERNGSGPCWGEPGASEWRDFDEKCLRMNRY